MLVYLLLFFFVSTVSTAKIVLVWGKVENAGVPEVYTEGWDGCVMKCLDEVGCVAIIPTSSGCQLFRLGTNLTVTVTKAEEHTGSKVGFKRTLNSCPASSEPPLFIDNPVEESFTLDDATYTYRIYENKSDSSTQWSFQFQGKIQCQADSLQMERGNRSVCVSVRPFTGTLCQNQTAGENLCKNNRGVGLTGPYTYEEGNILAGKLKQNCLNEPTLKSYPYCNFWVDGTKASNQPYQITDDSLNGTNGYQWYSPPDERQTCAFLSNEGRVYQNLCDRAHVKYSSCLRGVICRTKPVKYY